MSKSGIELSGFDDLEKALKPENIIKELLKDGIEIDCPNCHKSFKTHDLKATCPNCSSTINVNLE